MASLLGLGGSSSSAPPPTRPLVLQLHDTRLSIPLPSTADLWIAAEVVREEFYHQLDASARAEFEPLPALAEDDEDQDAAAAAEAAQARAAAREELYARQVKLLARFLAFATDKSLKSSGAASSDASEILLSAFTRFNALFLASVSVHTLTQAYAADDRSLVLAAYYRAFACLRDFYGSDKVPLVQTSALFRDAAESKAQVYALFSGQGSNEVYFEELRELYKVYGPLVAPFLRVASEYLAELGAKAEAAGHAYYAHGVQVLTWLNDSSATPPVDYLASVPLSLPLIGLTQLVQYLVACKVADLTPGQMRASFRGATGHSQGIVSAAAIASAESFADFDTSALKALRLLFAIGLRGQQAFPVLALDPKIIEDAIEQGEGHPTPMLGISGLQLKDLEAHIAKTNAHLAANSQLHVSLHNGPRNFVVTGPAKALYGLAVALRSVKAPAGLDQSKIPFSKRKMVFTARFMPINVPYHSPYLQGATERLMNEDLQGAELFEASSLAIEIYDTETGENLQRRSGSLTRSLCDQIFTSPIHWAKATDFPATATHAIDFGPGRASGIGGLTNRNLEGRGIRVLIVGEKGKNGAEVYSTGAVRYESRWSDKFSPKLVRTLDGKLHIDTPFSRLLGKAPIMVAGMTPCTVPAGFVSAILNAGYHVELAGGGHYNAKALRNKVAEIQRQIQPGVGITLNALYINQRQFGFQFPLWQEMRREGLPIEGFCVAAGIPSSEKATEIINALRAAGIKHIAFKPGSVEGIRQVVNIAAANPDYPIILQWTGGRAGGHHSCEDVHQPILSTYGSIRQHKNISLVAGSGFGGADDVWPYLCGDWSVKMFGAQPMPFDGVLFASRVMVAKEAHTSPSVKQLIVDAPGVSDDKWEGTYDKPTGGILTVRSELGEPIHKIATRAVKLWREFDDTVFNLPREKRAAWLEGKKDYVISRLNKDFNKPWFGAKADGTVVSDIAEMTYEEITRRMLRLMYVEKQSRWVDITLRNLTGDWLRRVEERFAGVNGTKVKESILQSFSDLDKPFETVDNFFAAYPRAKTQLVAAEDKAFFLTISQRPGQKPVPFIPILDNTFEVWFKKDSLWAAEDIDAVFDQDPQRVCILQGPVAVKYSTVADEPIKDMLGNIESRLARFLLERYYDGSVDKVPTVDYIGAKPATLPASLPGVEVQESASSRSYKIGSSVPPTGAWLEELAGKDVSWLRAVLTCVNVIQGTAYVSNPFKRVFTPRPNQRIEVALEDGRATSVAVYGAARSYGPHSADFKALELSFDKSSNEIKLTMNEERGGSSLPLVFRFKYRPDQGFAPIHEVVEGRNRAIKDFYWKLWFGDNESLPKLDLRSSFTCEPTVVDAATVERFCAVIGNQGESFTGARNDQVQAPMDFAIVTGWQSIMKAIFPDAIDGDLLKLVHLSNGFRLLDGARPLVAGDSCSAEARVVSVVNSDSGKTVKVKGFVLRDGEPVIEVSSSFLYRGRFTDFENTFEIVDEEDYVVEVETPTAVGVLSAKDWFQWDDEESPLAQGSSLTFKLKSELYYKDKTSFRLVRVSGAAFVRSQTKQLVQVATVDYEGSNSLGNPVTEYLKRHGKPFGLAVPLETGGYSLITDASTATFVTPKTNEPYSKISGDYNPIHINPYFSDFAVLPGTITHGMWSSAATRRYVETVAADNFPERVVSYNVGFVGMVLPGDELTVKLTHVAMKAGNKVLKVETFNQRGEKVIEGEAEVKQPPTAYVFTGQGSQEQGMGMELYANSPTARAVWDAADAHLGATYGFSIVDIVKNNPKELTIHFGGIKGQAIRQRYMDLTYDTVDKDGQVKTLPLFGDIDLYTTSYTFSHPQGLLFATQYTQIALVVTEKAAFDDMKAKGLIDPEAAFAGHSLGEYSALAAIADVLPISSLADVVFFRGITMQRAVVRDAEGKSQYAMMAVNPSRVSKTFNESALREIVDTISKQKETLLQIVNLNVANQQYVCAGELRALMTLTNVLNLLKVQKIDLVKLADIMTLEDVREKLAEIIDGCWQAMLDKEKDVGSVILERGFATIPLPGIDVPFHSRYLWPGVLSFRNYLSKKINPAQLNPDRLIGKYIPNLIAEPFEVSREYAQKIFDQTQSPRLEKIFKAWEQDNWDSEQNKQRLAYNLLVELLAYQFASPVRWIETQDKLFADFKFERLVEVGPSPTLTGMASRTLKAKYEAQDVSGSVRRAILCHAKNTKEVYYLFEDEAAEAEAAPAPAAASSTPAPAAAAAPAPVAAAPAAASAGPAAEVPDAPLKAVDTLRIIIAQKLKKAVAEVPLTKTIKDLVGGKSTLQNEILGDLQLEFSSAPEKGEELPLDELGAALNVGYPGSLGKHTSGLVSRMIGGKMPGGFNISAARAHVNKTWGLGPLRTDAALLHGITMEPPKRLGSEPEAKTWLDSVVAAYAQQAGITLSSGGGGGGSSGGSGGAVINSEEFVKFQAEQEEFTSRQIELLMRHIKKDPRAGERLYDQEKVNSAALQDKLDLIAREHGDAYISGIQGVFEPLKARHFDSSWNWARQDALIMWYDIIFGRLTTVDREITARCIAIMNRADPTLIDYMQYHIDSCPVEKGENYRLAKEFGQQLLENCREALASNPVYKDVTFPTAPSTEVNAKGDIVYSEVVRENVRKLEEYVKEMAAGGKITSGVNLDKVQSDVSKLWRLVNNQPSISKSQKAAIKSLYGEVLRSLGQSQPPAAKPNGRVARRNSSQFLRPNVPEPANVQDTKLPFLHLKRKSGHSWSYSQKLTNIYLDVLTEIATAGTSFAKKAALLTGVGRGSIGVEILKGLLAGGATCVVTTSRYSRAAVDYYKNIYHQVGSRGSKLVVVPFNGASKSDVEALVEYIYSTLAIDLDYIIPFAALPENGREIDGIDDKSELAHRLMLTNLLRLLGAVKSKKASRHFVTRPTQVVLPLSPNHGLFGNDGLYSESKISLETLFNRWSSESWGEYLCIAGAVIGWTRGTGLMSATNFVAAGIEKLGVRTFSAKEMAFNILGLMHPLLFNITQIEPIWADLNGGMDRLPDLADVTTKIRTDLNATSGLRKAITLESSADFKVVNGVDAERLHQKVTIAPRGNFQFNFPQLDEPQNFAKLTHLQGLIDLEKVVVVTGFAEVGPWGSSRTRWEMESRGEFTIEGCIEMAWMMGMIKHFDGRLKDGKTYVGWVDAKSSEPVDDKDIRSKYEKDILAHSGIRLIEPELFNGYNPEKKGFYQEVELIHDLEPLEISKEDAERFKREQGDKCDVWAQESGEWFVKFKRGARVLVPKAIKFDRVVAGQIPTGWDARRYGIPDDIIAQTDRTALWALVCTMEALIMSGVTDPYELYKHIHPSELGTSLGSGMGGMRSLSAMFKDRREEKDVQKDILQETFINTVAGWVNLLLLSSSGPVKIPVGACATALQSVEIACDTILSGKAKVMIAGGFDDFSEEGSYEFANMKATSNSETEFAMGREPNEFSRPMTSTRAGFMESQGCGVHVLMSAKTAIEMGATIQGIVAYTSTHTDKAGRSIPAPGRGVLSTAREVTPKEALPLLDVKYRARQLAFRRKQISQWFENEQENLREELSLRTEQGLATDDAWMSTRVSFIEDEARRQEREAMATFGMLEGSDPRIAPLRRALAVWGLNADSIGVISCHGTSTKANDKNESGVYNLQFEQLGRTAGNAVPVITQKYLTGHPKGGAAAWMFNGLLQVLEHALIPGNANADNISEELRAFPHLFYPSKSIQHVQLEAGLMTSFGFGQVGGQVAIVHPRYLFAALQPAQFKRYTELRQQRQLRAYSRMSSALVANNLVQIKDGPPYTPEVEGSVLLNPLARAVPSAKSFAFAKGKASVPIDSGNAAILKEVLGQASGVQGVGVDTELITSVPTSETFRERNFTSSEIEYCSSAPDPIASFAGRWAAKEAVFKALSVPSKGAGASMKDIEIVSSEAGPQVKLHGDAASAGSGKSIKVSISHSDAAVVAFAVAQ